MKTSEKLKKNVKPIAIAGAAAVCLGIAGVSAYFTDAAKITNTFTVGKVEITPHEPSWDPPTDITPNQPIPKDPTVENTGSNPAYVFVQVKVPKAEVIVSEQNGSKNAAAVTQLFTYDIDTENWALIDSDETAEDSNLYTYVYGTSEHPAVLEKTETTEPLFSTIKFANVIEGQVDEDQLNVEVTAYAIQTTWLDENEGEDSSATLTSAQIWDILSTQGPDAPDVTDDVLAENGVGQEP